MHRYNPTPSSRAAPVVRSEKTILGWGEPPPCPFQLARYGIAAPCTRKSEASPLAAPNPRAGALRARDVAARLGRMEWIVSLVAFAVVAFVLWGAGRLLAPPTDTRKPATKRSTSAPRPAPVQLVAHPITTRAPAEVSTPVTTAPPLAELDPADVADLRELPCTRYRIKGSAFVVSDLNRERFGGTEYQLRREPKNRHDANAIAVYGQGRRVGYISAAKAASIAPLLDVLPEMAFTVGGMGVVGNSIRLWVDVPSLPALRQYVKTRTLPTR